MITQTRLVNLKQLEFELRAAGLVIDVGICSWGTFIVQFDAVGDPVEIDAQYQYVVDSHIAHRQKTPDEYAIEFRDANPTRQSEINGIMNGLLLPELVVDDSEWPIKRRLPIERQP